MKYEEVIEMPGLDCPARLIKSAGSGWNASTNPVWSKVGWAENASGRTTNTPPLMERNHDDFQVGLPGTIMGHLQLAWHILAVLGQTTPLFVPTTFAAYITFSEATGVDSLLPALQNSLGPTNGKLVMIFRWSYLSRIQNYFFHNKIL